MAMGQDKQCGGSCNNHCGTNNSFLIILVLYILLAILLGSCILY